MFSISSFTFINVSACIHVLQSIIIKKRLEFSHGLVKEIDKLCLCISQKTLTNCFCIFRKEYKLNIIFLQFLMISPRFKFGTNIFGSCCFHGTVGEEKGPSRERALFPWVGGGREGEKRARQWLFLFSVFLTC